MGTALTGGGRDAPHALTAEAVARRLGTDPVTGLPQGEADKRFESVGPNELAKAKRPAYAAIAVRQFVDPLVALLVAAVVVSAAMGDGVEAGAIGAIVLLNAILGFTQEVGAERAVFALRRSLQEIASVVRDGREREIDAERLVPGDLLVLREGERVPADARLVSASGFAVDESILTGESVPVDKGVDPVAPDAPLAERLSMAFAGTSVTRGEASALVTATAGGTELGEIAGLTAGAKPPSTPLERRIRGLARVMVVAGLVVTLALAAAMAARGASAEEAFLVAVAVAVAAVPEGLAATVTIALALGARAMAARGAIVRRLGAVETLGSATVVASDKTGTLTQNRLRLAAVAPAPGLTERDVLTAAVLASTARLVEEEGQVRAAGDPVDGAILLAAHERGIRPPGDARPMRTLPFDPVRKRMSVVYRDGDGAHLFLKGAPEVVFDLAFDDGKSREGLERVAELWAAEGLRVLAVAERRLEHDEADAGLERELTPVGLVALHDPLRETASAAVAEARAAGLRVEMVTGDHPVTARAIGRSLGLPDDAVHARVAPVDKLRLVERLQAEGEVVAVTGDGVNDAPALRRADVGVAMGRSGTEAAREAADLVLTDDDFATIIAAIREGRAITDNLRKFVAFLLSANLGEVVLFAVAILAGFGAPMTVVQVLVINVLTDGLPAVALVRDPASPATMRRPPGRGTELLGRRVWAGLAFVGLLVGLAGLAAFLIGPSGDAAQARAFTTVALAELALVFSLRSRLEPAWRAPWNPYLALGVAASLAIVTLVLLVPPLQEPLATSGLSLRDVTLAAGLALVPAATVEAAKAALRAMR